MAFKLFHSVFPFFKTRFGRSISYISQCWIQLLCSILSFGIWAIPTGIDNYKCLIYICMYFGVDPTMSRVTSKLFWSQIRLGFLSCFIFTVVCRIWRAFLAQEEKIKFGSGTPCCVSRCRSHSIWIPNFLFHSKEKKFRFSTSQDKFFIQKGGRKWREKKERLPASYHLSMKNSFVSFLYTRFFIAHSLFWGFYSIVLGLSSLLFEGPRFPSVSSSSSSCRAMNFQYGNEKRKEREREQKKVETQHLSRVSCFAFSAGCRSLGL